MTSDDNHLTGIWYSPSGKKECEYEQGNSPYWGHFDFKFSSPDAFKGTWTRCDSKKKSGKWNGTLISRTRVAPSPVAATNAPTTTLSRLAGAWMTDFKALNQQNKKEGKPSESGVPGQMTIDATNWVRTFAGEAEKSTIHLANETVWDGDVCRGGTFDAAVFKKKHQDDNGTVIVTRDADDETFCYTIETLSKDKLVLGYVGARLNLHFYKRPK